MELEKAINLVKAKRKIYIKKSVTTALFFIVALAYFYINLEISTNIFLFLAFPFSIIIYGVYINLYEDYKNFYKDKFIKNIVNSFGFNFEKESVLYDKELEKLTFINHMSNAYDRISGEHDGVKFELFEANLDYNGNENVISTIFACEFYKNFRSKTIAIRKKSRFKPPFTKPILLDSDKFNDSFRIYSDDKIEARYIFSPSFMERILKLLETKSVDRIVFNDSHFYLFIVDNKNRYEPNILKDDINFIKADEIKAEISAFLSIIETLNLSLRIYKI